MPAAATAVMISPRVHCHSTAPRPRERVVDMAAAKVTAVLPDARPVLVPRPKDHRRMRLVHEQVPRRPQQPRNLASPPSQIGHPDQGALPRIDQIGARTGQRYSGNGGGDVPAGDAELVRAALRGADGHLAVVDPDHRFRSGLHEGDIIQAMAARGIHNGRLLPVPPLVKRLCSPWPPSANTPALFPARTHLPEARFPGTIQQSQFVFPGHRDMCECSHSPPRLR